MADTKPDSGFNSTYEAVALNFLHRYDTGKYVWDTSLEYSTINDNVTNAEVERAIDYLKNNRSPGIDGIPVELIKCCKIILAVDITLVLN